LQFFVDDHTPPALARDFVLTLGVPVLFAGMAGTVVGKHNPWVRDYYGVPSFTATRPMTTAGLVAAILRAAVRTTLLTWAIVVAMTAAAVTLSGAAAPLGELGERWLAARPAAEVAATLTAAAVLLLVLTWKQLVENLLIGLTGREWVIKGYMFFGATAASGVAVAGLWLLVHPEHYGTAKEWLPRILAALVALKLTAAAAVAAGLRRKRLVADRTLAAVAGIWSAVVAVLGGTLVWVVPADWAAGPTIVMTVALMVPLARVSALPLALDWNRHR